MRRRSVAVMAALVATFVGGVTVLRPAPAHAAPATILLVRHAERAPASMLQDPPLTDAGRARAARLAAVLGRADVAAIYVTRFQRSRDTAAPLAAARKIEPVVESETRALIAKLQPDGAAAVLVVGHADTVPEIVRAFGGPALTIGDDEFDDLFVLTPATGSVLRLKY